MNDMIQTNLGPMTGEQIEDELEYRRYRYHIIGLHVAHETMERWYGPDKAREYQTRLRAEQALSKGVLGKTPEELQAASNLWCAVVDGINDIAAAEARRRGL